MFPCMSKTKANHHDDIDWQKDAVRQYLNLVLSVPIKLVGKSDSDISKQLEAVNKKIAADNNDVLVNLDLIQLRMDLQKRLEFQTPENVKLRTNFCLSAKNYSELNGITATAWQELGIPRETLQKAGIVKTRSKRKI